VRLRAGSASARDLICVRQVLGRGNTAACPIGGAYCRICLLSFLRAWQLSGGIVFTVYE
jgi:hypothetical protein